uniref:Transmembrane protein 157 n=1 Tax=Sphenodon punctatus TaxID=8508 RepID=A0A8D0GED4_SPHPU
MWRPLLLRWFVCGLLLGALGREAAHPTAEISSLKPPSPPPSASPPSPGRGASPAARSSSLAAVQSRPEQSQQPMTQRALVVLVLASAALIVYFVVRTVRLRRRNRKTRRYGVLDTNIENMELTPLEQDDDDDDTTLFDANHPRRLVSKVKCTLVAGGVEER